MAGPTVVNVLPVPGASTIAENTVLLAPKVVGYVTAIDFDGGTNLFTLEGADASLFQLTRIGNNNYALELRAGAVFDFETNPQLDVGVRVRDAATPNAAGRLNAFSMQVTNVNDAPVITSNGGGDSATILLARGDTAVTTVQASDED
ncbi:MAG TPA: cadherin repeat domain-containing protein, partial [Burkholderiaceae bacterium]